MSPVIGGPRHEDVERSQKHTAAGNLATQRVSIPLHPFGWRAHDHIGRILGHTNQ